MMETNQSGVMKTLLIVTAAFGGAFVGTLATHTLAPAPALKESAEKQMNANFAEIGKAFVSHYYTTFDSNRDNLQALYTDRSMLTFENEQFMGIQAIMTKLTTLQFQTVKHEVTTQDCQPTPSDGILCLVTGVLVADGNTAAPLKYAQTFHLMPMPDGALWSISNDLFRLNYD